MKVEYMTWSWTISLLGQMRGTGLGKAMHSLSSLHRRRIKGKMLLCTLWHWNSVETAPLFPPPTLVVQSKAELHLSPLLKTLLRRAQLIFQLHGIMGLHVSRNCIRPTYLAPLNKRSGFIILILLSEKLCQSVIIYIIHCGGFQSSAGILNKR